MRFLPLTEPEKLQPVMLPRFTPARPPSWELPVSGAMLPDT